ncbi:hypothetical protein [Kineosporia succinea]|uniref:Uncharacterized protein n=1 Tax=Kineosporia succinea TaxID=84632 RepID=A0ABT9PBE7_9ACTN|nr:hypothetical protein [Kineosporia succinea]MDP9830029.1 hypothetical protein [Kineosporia succinea]
MTSWQTRIWMLEDDVVAFGKQVSARLPAAWWMCSRPGPAGLHRVHAHAALDEALACSGAQAFLPLPAGAQPPAGALAGPGVATDPDLRVAALVQFLGTREHPADLWGAGHLEAGHLMARLSGDDLEEQRRVIWQALEEVTSPARLRLPDGSTDTCARIGAQARSTAGRLALSRGGEERLTLQP